MAESAAGGSEGSSRESRDSSGSFVSAGFLIAVVVVALVVAVALSRILLAHPLAHSGPAAVWFSPIGVWVPLVAAIVVGSVVTRSARPSHDGFGAARWIRPVDLAWGIAAGLVARTLDALLSVAATGSTGLSPLPTLAGGPTGALTVALVLAPVIVGPVIEELFFRGLAQGAVTRILLGPSRHRDPLSAWTAAALVAVVFAIVHVLVAPDDPVLLTVGGTFLLGLAAGGLVAVTGRVGGAVVAHIVFNGVAVLLTWQR